MTCAITNETGAFPGTRIGAWRAGFSRYGAWKMEGQHGRKAGAVVMERLQHAYFLQNGRFWQRYAFVCAIVATLALIVAEGAARACGGSGFVTAWYGGCEGDAVRHVAPAAVLLAGIGLGATSAIHLFWAILCLNAVSLVALEGLTYPEYRYEPLRRSLPVIVKAWGAFLLRSRRGMSLGALIALTGSAFDAEWLESAGQ